MHIILHIGQEKNAIHGMLLIPALYLMHDLFGLAGIAAAHTAADFGAILTASVLGLRGYR